MFASQVREDVRIDEDVVVIRKLSARALRKARELVQNEFIANMKGYGKEILDFFNETRNIPIGEQAAKDREKSVEEQERIRFAKHDREHVLQVGVHSWTCTDKEGKEIALEDGLPDLDEPTAQLLFERILKLSLPPINAEAAEEIRAKD